MLPVGLPVYFMFGYLYVFVGLPVCILLFYLFAYCCFTLMLPVGFTRIPVCLPVYFVLVYQHDSCQLTCAKKYNDSLKLSTTLVNY